MEDISFYDAVISGKLICTIFFCQTTDLEKSCAWSFILKYCQHLEVHKRKTCNPTSKQGMAQNDFGCLTVAEHDAEQMPDACFPVSPLASERTCSGDEDCVLVNFIPEEVRAMIDAWQLAEQERQELTEVSDATCPNLVFIAPSSASDDVFEPIRCIPNAAPPKRFHRTFWRSVTRRLLEREREALFAQRRVASAQPCQT